VKKDLRQKTLENDDTASKLKEVEKDRS
jgi:hypothetical protein